MPWQELTVDPSGAYIHTHARTHTSTHTHTCVSFLCAGYEMDKQEQAIRHWLFEMYSKTLLMGMQKTWVKREKQQQTVFLVFNRKMYTNNIFFSLSFRHFLMLYLTKYVLVLMSFFPRNRFIFHEDLRWSAAGYVWVDKQQELYLYRPRLRSSFAPRRLLKNGKWFYLKYFIYYHLYIYVLYIFHCYFTVHPFQTNT